MNPTPATVTTPGYLAGIWKADPAHSEIGFSARLLMVGKVRGQFTSYDVTIVTSDDPLGSSVAAQIDLASIDTGNERRDNHLRSADFFEVKTYPAMSYRSTAIRRADDGWIIDGDLTLHGVTRPVPLAVEANRFGPDPDGARRARFTATAQISRADFGVGRWAGGGAVVGGKVPISLRIEAVLQP
jgi:polyisoprenoid-binding protein YceI